MARQSQSAAVPEILSLDEIAARYQGEWILLKITEYDEHRLPWRGHVLEHSPHEADITRAFAKEPPIAELPAGTSYYIFQAYPHVYSGEGWRAILDRMHARKTTSMSAGEPETSSPRRGRIRPLAG